MSKSFIHVDSVISPQWIASMNNANSLLENHSIVIHEQRILDIIPSDQVPNQYTTEQHISLPQHIVIPGFINSHCHAAMSLLRGIADDLPLMTWLQDHIWPAESKWVSESFVKAGTRLAIAEQIKSGVTYTTDMYFFPEAAAEVAKEAQIKSCFFTPILDFPTNWSSSATEALEKSIDLHKTYKGDPLVEIGLGPHAPYTVADPILTQIADLSEQHNLTVQIHLHETAHEVEQSLTDYGKRPIQRLAELGILSKQTQYVHMTQIAQSDIDLLQKHGGHVIHCPESNMKLASGFCPTQRLLSSGINIALGTDGSASNNDLDMLGEVRSAALVAKGSTCDAAAIAAYEALQMATINGAKALGKDADIGSVEVGKFADLQAIDLNHLRTLPVYNPVSQLVYAASSDQIRYVWVNGSLKLEAGRLTTLDEESIKLASAEWGAKIKAS